jgi:hypothetical protein
VKRLLLFLLLPISLFSQGNNRVYQTDFPYTQNPISESSNWSNNTSLTGHTAVQIQNAGNATGTAVTGATPPPYRDGVAVLNGAWQNNQGGCITLHTVNQNASIFEESEIRLRTTVGSTLAAPGWEFNIRNLTAGGTLYSQINQINSDGTFATATGVTAQANDGDYFCAVANGTTLASFQWLASENFSTKHALATTTNATYPTGKVGIGFYLQGGTTANYADFGAKNFTGVDATGTVRLANSCATADVQTEINNSSTTGDTIIIPPCPAGVAWTTGVNLNGKAITITGAGSGRIIAINTASLTIALSPLSITIQSARADGTYPLGPGVGQILRVFQVATRQNWMQGTVTSFNSSTGALSMNITSTSGTTASLQQHHWGISTVPQTVISNNSTAAPMFSVKENISTSVSLGGIKFLQGTTVQAGAYDVGINNTVGGKATLIHDCWMEAGAGSGQIEALTNRGVVWNCSFDATPFAQGGTVNSTLNVLLPPSSALSMSSWTSPSLWGAQDTTGQGNFYFETNDVHAYLVSAGTDDGGRLNYRYNFNDNAGFAVHGADSSPGGNRYFDYNNNLGIFGGYSDGHSTLNMQNWILIRGGSMLVHDNALPDLVSGDGGQKGNIIMAVWNLQWNINANHCWGSGFVTPGQYWPVPRQIGRGYTTGTSTANYPPDGVNNSTTDTTGYFVGDLDPVYIWNNSGAVGPNGGNSFSLSDGLNIGSNCPAGYDSVVNYAVQNRDFYILPKPGYVPYTYPHPLTGISTGAVSFSPNPLNFPFQTVGTTSAASFTQISNTGAANFTVSTISTTGPFAYTGTGTGACPPVPFTLSPASNCFLGVTYSPVVPGVSSGTLSVTDSSPGSPHTVTLSGSAPIVQFSPPSVAFGNQNVNTASAGQLIALTNVGSSTMTVSSVAVNSAFSLIASPIPCGSVPFTLAVGQSCEFNVTFTPSASIAYSGTLSISDNAAGSPHTVPLTGQGTVPAISWLCPGPAACTTYAFGSIAVGSSLNSANITLGNTGSGPLNVSLTIGGANPSDFSIFSTTCGTTLAAGASCNVVVRFTPVSAASFNATLVETDSVQSLTSNVALTGSGTTAPTTTSAPAIQIIL